MCLNQRFLTRIFFMLVCFGIVFLLFIEIEEIREKKNDARDSVPFSQPKVTPESHISWLKSKARDLYWARRSVIQGNAI